MRAFAAYLAIALSFLNLFLQIPLTPVHARDLTTDLGLVGLAVAAYSIANLAGNLFAGLLVDRLPPAPLIAGGLGLGGLALIAAGAGPRDVGWLIGCLASNGLAMAVVTPAAFTAVLTAAAADARARDVARSGAAIGLAALLGPPIGGRLGDVVGAPLAYQAAGATLLVAGLLVLPLLARGRYERPEDGEGPSLAAVRMVATAPALRGAYAASFVLMTVNGALVFLLPPTVRAMGLPGAATGGLFGVFAIVAIALFLSPAPRVLPRVGAPAVTAAGAAIVAAACAALAAAGSLPLMGVAMAAYGLGFGLVYLGAASALAANAPATLRGTATGIFYAVFSLGAALGPIGLARLGLGGPSGFAAAAVPPAALALALGAAGLIRRVGR